MPDFPQRKIAEFLCPVHGRCRGCQASDFPLAAPRRAWRRTRPGYRWPYYFLIGETRAVKTWTRQKIKDPVERERWRAIGNDLIERWTRYASAQLWQAES